MSRVSFSDEGEHSDWGFEFVRDFSLETIGRTVLVDELRWSARRVWVAHHGTVRVNGEIFEVNLASYPSINCLVGDSELAGNLL